MDEQMPQPEEETSQQNLIQRGQTSQTTVNVPVEKVVKLLQHYMSHHTTNKSPLTRSKSDPIKGTQMLDPKRKSVPEIFIFPELKENTPDSETTLGTSESLSIDGHAETVKSSELMPGSVNGVHQGTNARHEYSVGKTDILPLSLSHEERKASCPGVSEVYFKNLVNELVKTKKYVKDLQNQLKLLVQNNVGNDNLKRELQSLRFTAQQLQREHKLQAEQNKRLKLKLKAYQPVGMNESFELEATEDSEFRERAVQTEFQQGGLHGTEKNMQEMIDELKKENMVLNQHYSDLKDNVKILNSCLTEEKQKNNKKDKLLVEKEEEKIKIFSQLASRRQEYDEMKQEFDALKKELDIYRDGQPYHRSRHSSRSSGINTPYGSQPSSRMSSSEQIRLNITPDNQSRHRHDSQGSSRSSYRIPFQNDLSSLDDEARAPSNNPPNSGRDYPDQSASARLSQTSVGYGISDTQAHPELICPTCLQTFQEDQSFFKHLIKCYSY